MKDTYSYEIDKNLYINLTNRCSNSCTFCVRNEKASYYGNYLWLKEGEPSVQQVEESIHNIKDYKEVVFCGFGEPTERLDTMLTLAEWIHSQGGKTRLNTNGHGSVLNGKNIAPLLKGKIDSINISLNASNEEKYNQICVPHISNAFENMLQFARDCKTEGIHCWFSVVDCIGKEEVEKCRKIAEKVGIPLKVRAFIQDS